MVSASTARYKRGIQRIRWQHALQALVLALLFALAACGGQEASAPTAPPPAPTVPPPPPPPPPPSPSPAPEPPPAAGNGSGPGAPVIDIRASRLFAGPGQYPPRDFAAYGILAFRALATPDSLARYEAICRGYLAGIPAASSLEALGVPINQQMATVWPLDDRELAGFLNATNQSAAAQYCNEVASAIDLATSLNAIQRATRASGAQAFTGPGPYLLAWSPSSSVGESDAIVLVWDLSDVVNVEQATRMFADWAVEIEQNPALWDQGWNLEKLRTRIRLWADKYGADVLKILGELT